MKPEKIKKILVVVGTRPEGIKLAPLILELQKVDQFQTKVVTTAQHRELLDNVLAIFGITPDYDLNIMRSEQTLSEITCRALLGMERLIEKDQPDMIIIQGDTTTSYAAALAGFYNKIPVVHVEAGLRTQKKYYPFPEEINRRLSDQLSDYLFAPTPLARERLIQEGLKRKEVHISVTGNTVLDAMETILHKKIDFGKTILKSVNWKKRIILLTTHRRENFGKPMENICRAVKRVVDEFHDVEFVFPVHPNPNVKKVAIKELKGLPNIWLVSPLPYDLFIHAMSRCYFLLTDSGGLQEEGPALGKPVLILRQETERDEALREGAARLIGTEEDNIVFNILKLLRSQIEYKKMAQVRYPFGRPGASKKIIKVLKRFLN